MEDPVAFSILLVVFVALLVGITVFFTAFLRRSYKACPPNKVLVVSSMGPREQARAKYFRGTGSAVVLPGLHHAGYLPLSPIRISVPVGGPVVGRPNTEQFPRSMTVTVGTSEVELSVAASRLLDLSDEQIAAHAQSTVLSLYQELAQQSDSPPALSDLRLLVDERLSVLGLRSSAISYEVPSG